MDCFCRTPPRISGDYEQYLNQATTDTDRRLAMMSRAVAFWGRGEERALEDCLREVLRLGSRLSLEELRERVRNRVRQDG